MNQPDQALMHDDSGKLDDAMKEYMWTFISRLPSLQFLIMKTKKKAVEDGEEEQSVSRLLSERSMPILDIPLFNSGSSKNEIGNGCLDRGSDQG